MKTKLTKNNIKEIVDRYELQRENEQKFIENKEYIEILNDLIGKTVSNDDYINPSRWTEKVQMTFDLIYGAALELIIKTLDFDGEIILNYKNNLMSFVEIQGQGCFQIIQPVEKAGDIENPEYIVDFDDLENFIRTGEQPERLYVMKTVFLALDALELFNNHYDVKIDIDEIKDYIQKNLD